MPGESKTIAKSFRVDQEAFEALREEAHKQTISLNTLVNQLLVSYSEFGRYMKQMHSITLTRQTFSQMLSAIPEDKLVEFAKDAGKNVPEAVITSKYGKMTLNGLIEFIHYLSAYANMFEYSEKDENGHWTVTLTHELGRKWSLFIANYMEQAMVVAGVKPKCIVSDRSITVSI